jgi:hypothetical protein
MANTRPSKLRRVERSFYVKSKQVIAAPVLFFYVEGKHYTLTPVWAELSMESHGGGATISLLRSALPEAQAELLESLSMQPTAQTSLEAPDSKPLPGSVATSSEQSKPQEVVAFHNLLSEQRRTNCLLIDLLNILESILKPQASKESQNESGMPGEGRPGAWTL